MIDRTKPNRVSPAPRPRVASPGPFVPVAPEALAGCAPGRAPRAPGSVRATSPATGRRRRLRTGTRTLRGVLRLVGGRGRPARPRFRRLGLGPVRSRRPVAVPRRRAGRRLTASQAAHGKGARRMRADEDRLPLRSASRRTSKDRRSKPRKSSRTRPLDERVTGIVMRNALRVADSRHNRQAGTRGLRHGQGTVDRAAQALSGRDEATAHRGCRAAAGRPGRRCRRRRFGFACVPED